MKTNFEQCLAFVLKEEGGFVNNPADPGGATNHGVTKKVWEDFVGHPVTVDDMKALTIEQVGPLYKNLYWDRLRGDDLPSGLDYACFDFAVNSGVGRAAKFLQRICGVSQDGSIGPATLDAINSHNARTLSTQLCEERLAFLQGLPTWGVFGKGWGARVKRVEERAFDMVN